MIGAGASGQHQWVIIRPLTGQHRYAAQVQHIEDVGIAHLILQGKVNKIHLMKGCLAFQGCQRQASLPQQRFHIAPGRANPFAPYLVHLIQAIIKDSKP